MKPLQLHVCGQGWIFPVNRISCFSDPLFRPYPDLRLSFGTYKCTYCITLACRGHPCRKSTILVIIVIPTINQTVFWYQKRIGISSLTCQDRTGSDGDSLCCLLTKSECINSPKMSVTDKLSMSIQNDTMSSAVWCRKINPFSSTLYHLLSLCDICD